MAGRREGLGNFELMVLLAVIRLADDAYGLPISQEIESRTGREVALGSVYSALERLQGKGFVAMRLGDPTPERGGRAKKYFKATARGLREARDTQQALLSLWKDLPGLRGAES